MPSYTNPTAAQLAMPTYAADLTVEFDASISQTVGLPFKLTGTVSIDWGDGTTEDVTGIGWKEHTYAGTAKYIATFSGTITEIWASASPAGRYDALTKITSWGDSPLVKIWLYQTTNLVEVPPNLPAGVTSINELFKESGIDDSNVLAWDTRGVVDWGEFLKDADNFNQQIGYLRTESGVNFERALGGMASFNQHLRGWDMTNADDLADFMNGATAMNSRLWEGGTPALVSVQNFALGAALFNQHLPLDTANCPSMSNLLNGAAAFNQDIDHLRMDSATNVSSMLSAAASFRGKVPLSFPVATNANFWMQSAAAFDGDLDAVDFPLLVTAKSMLQNTTNFVGKTLASWTLPNLTDAESMLAGSGFDGLLTSFAPTGLLKIKAFARTASNFVAPLDHVNVSLVANFDRVFQGSAYNSTLASWDTSSATQAVSMFDGASNFNQDISGWCVSGIATLPTNFAANGCPLVAGNTPVWGTCP